MAPIRALRRIQLHRELADLHSRVRIPNRALFRSQRQPHLPRPHGRRRIARIGRRSGLVTRWIDRALGSETRQLPIRAGHRRRRRRPHGRAQTELRAVPDDLDAPRLVGLPHSLLRPRSDDDSNRRASRRLRLFRCDALGHRLRMRSGGRSPETGLPTRPGQQRPIHHEWALGVVPAPELFRRDPALVRHRPHRAPHASRSAVRHLDLANLRVCSADAD